MNRLKTLVLVLGVMTVTTVMGQEYDYSLNAIFEQKLDDYILLRLNRYRSDLGLAPLGKTFLPDRLQIANEEYLFDVLYEEDSAAVDELYEYYFNTDEINSAPGCIAYNGGGLTFTQQKTLTFRKKDFAQPAKVPTEHEVIEQWSEWNRFDEMVAPDSVHIIESYLAMPEFAEVLGTGGDTTVWRYVSIAHNHGVNDVVKLRENRRKVVYQFELRYVINLVLYANKK